MPLWGSVNRAEANLKPLFGAVKYQGIGNVLPGANNANTFGITANGYANSSGVFGGRGGPGHAGWVTMIQGRGYLQGIDAILTFGNNISNLSYHSANITGGNGSGANVLVTSVNGNGAVGNVLTLQVVAQGSRYNGAVNICIVGRTSAATENCYARPLMSSKTGAYKGEVLVAMGSLSGTDPVANNWFVNNQ